MASKRTTHELAALLVEVADALRQMPDKPLSELKPRATSKVNPTVDIVELATRLPQLSKEEVTLRLNELGQRQLIQLCKQLKLNMGSKRTKSSLVNQVLWQFFESKDELERIRTYEEKSG